MKNLVIPSLLIAALQFALGCGTKQEPEIQSAATQKEAPTRVLLTDGKGHFVVAQRPNLKQMPDTKELYYGDGKVFHQLYAYTESSFYPAKDFSGYKFEYGFWSPQVDPVKPGSEGTYPLYHGGLTVTGADKLSVHFTLRCGYRTTELSLVPDAEAKFTLANASYLPILHDRTAFFLARDDRGRYYFVDRRDNAHGGKDFRVYAGMKGQMKLMPLTNIVDDAQGTIFSTKTGELRLIAAANDYAAQWIAAKKKTNLVVLQVGTQDTESLIYTKLGVYQQRLGTPCDDL